MRTLASKPRSGEAPAVVDRLRAGFASGQSRPLPWRRHQLQRLKALLVENEEELLAALAADLGKPRVEGWATDIGIVVSEIEHTLRRVKRWTKPQKVRLPFAQRPGRARVYREPLGVVLVIAPWNYPIHLQLLPMVGAIAAGNCVVGKPSEISAHTSATLARLVPMYLDPECIAVVEGGPTETERLLAQRFDHVFYTGGARVGRVVMEAAAKHLTPVTLELGGKSPVIVAEDADLDVAARRIAWGKYLNAGQTCVAPDYALVAEGLRDQLVERIGRAVTEFYGDDPEASPDYARIVNEAHFRRLEALLGDGTPAVGGGVHAEKRYIAPTVLEEVALDAPVMSEEIFGPVLPIVPVDDLDEAIAFVNDRPHPLALYLFSRSDAIRDQVVAGTTSGGVAVNATMLHLAIPDLPFGGVGASGFGAYHGRASFETFTHRKSVLTKSTRFDPRLGYPPYTKRKERWLRRFL